MSFAAPLIDHAIAKHTATVIICHGLGDSGAGWTWLASSFRSQNKFEGVKFIFPNAPVIPITVQGGRKMSGWYDIRVFGDRSTPSQDQEGIIQSQQFLHQLVQDEIKAGIPSDRVVLGGFSQGGSISIFSGSTAPMKLAGIFCLSGFLLLSENIEDFIPKNSANQVGKTPIFLGHGDSDPIVKPELAQLTYDTLRKLGWNADLKIYKGLGHTSSKQELLDLETYLDKVIPAVNSSTASSH